MTNRNLELNDNALIISGDIRPCSGSGTIIGDATDSTIIFDNSSSARTIEAGDIQNNRRAYRMLTSAINSTGSINANW